MAIVTIKPGESVDVEFAESDGKIIVQFNEDSIRVIADMPDSEGREGIIYNEQFGNGSLPLPFERRKPGWYAHPDGGEVHGPLSKAGAEAIGGHVWNVERRWATTIKVQFVTLKSDDGYQIQYSVRGTCPIFAKLHNGRAIIGEGRFQRSGEIERSDNVVTKWADLLIDAELRKAELSR